MPAYAPLVDLADLDGANGYVLTGSGAGASSGWALAAGDFNGDRQADLMVGAPVANEGKGAAHLVFGETGPRPASLDLGDLDGSDGFTLLGAAKGVDLGTSLAVGDINGDGIDDMIVGARFADFSVDEPDAGQAYVLFGRRGEPAAVLDAADLDGTNGFRFEGQENAEAFGMAVAAADLNGDGIDDLVVGAPGSDPVHGHDEVAHNAEARGVAYVVFGRSNHWDAVSDHEAAGALVVGRDASGRGASALATGDFNGDGAEDLLMGSPDAAELAGEAYVVFGGPGFAGEIDAAALDGGNGLVLAGFDAMCGAGATAAMGDLNGDGRADAAVGAPSAGAGSVWVAFGRADRMAEIDVAAPDGTSVVRIDGLAAGDRLGASIAIGDVNGDGIGDLVIGATGAGEAGRPEAGVAYVVFGKAGGWDAAIDLDALDGDNGYRLVGPSAHGFMGASVSVADLDGDLLADIAVGGYLGGDQSGLTAVAFSRLAAEAVTRFGTAGADLLHGGLRADRLGGSEGDDLVLGHGGGDRIGGGAGLDRLKGQAGDDRLAGGDDDDRLHGGQGADLLDGGRGADLLVGGKGADKFVFGAATHSAAGAADLIADLAADDVIDLSAIDADTGTGGDQAFVLVSGFSGHAGEAALEYQASRGETALRLDVDGDGLADAVIRLTGDQTGHTAFVL